MSKDTVNKCRKIDSLLKKVTISLLVILLISQWYLRTLDNGIEGFLNKLYIDEGLSFKAIDVIPERINNINENQTNITQ